jgi:hypothetical protein
MLLTEALSALGITEWVLNGDPKTEAEFTTMFGKITGTDASDTAIVSHNPSDWGFTWTELKSKSDELEAAAPLKALRAERDRLIASTDWWASSDLTMTAEQSAYRQALRDITETYSSLEDVVWPVKPE